MKSLFGLFMSGIFIFFLGNLSAQDIQTFVKDNHPTAQKAQEGLYYSFEKEGKGKKPKVGDYLVVNFVGKNLEGKIFDKSEEEPFIFQLGYRQVIQGWDIGLQNVPLGSKVNFFLAPSVAYAKVGAGELVPPNTPVQFEVELLQILNDDQYDEYMVALEKRERESYERHIKEQFIQDKKAIQDYCAENSIRSKRTNSGVSYSINKKGKGDFPKEGQIITMEYTGTLLDGTPFETRKSKEPFSFVYGRNKAIKGLEEAIVFFNKNAKGKIIIPSKMAYGPREIMEENINLPANSILIFDIKILSIKDAEK